MKRYEVWLVNLDPTVGHEIQKARPAVIVSPDDLNDQLGTVVVVPLTTGRSYPFRVATVVHGRAGVAAIDQLRAVDKSRLVKKIGALDMITCGSLRQALVRMFSP